MDKRAEARKRYIESDISQRELAAEMGVPQRTLARWSKEENWPEQRQQHGTRMAALRQQAMEKAVGEEKVQEVAKALADDLEKYRKALDFTLGLAIKGLREPGLRFKDLGQGIGAVAKLIQSAVTVQGVKGDESNGEQFPEDIAALFRAGGAVQPAPVRPAQGSEGDSPESEPV